MRTIAQDLRHALGLVDELFPHERGTDQIRQWDEIARAWSEMPPCPFSNPPRRQPPFSAAFRREAKRRGWDRRHQRRDARRQAW